MTNRCGHGMENHHYDTLGAHPLAARAGLWILDYLVYFAGAIIIGENLHDFNNIMGYTVWIPAIAALGSWLLGIADTVRRGMWGWFVLVLIAPVLGSLIYSAVTLRSRQPQIA